MSVAATYIHTVRIEVRKGRSMASHPKDTSRQKRLDDPFDTQVENVLAVLAEQSYIQRSSIFYSPPEWQTLN